MSIPKNFLCFHFLSRLLKLETPSPVFSPPIFAYSTSFAELASLVPLTSRSNAAGGLNGTPLPHPASRTRRRPPILPLFRLHFVASPPLFSTGLSPPAIRLIRTCSNHQLLHHTIHLPTQSPSSTCTRIILPIWLWRKWIWGIWKTLTLSSFVFVVISNLKFCWIWD